MMLKLKNINKQFDSKPILKDINLEINDGEFLVLLGPSGCGKTTLLRIIAGLEQACTGVIEHSGREIQDLAPKDRELSMVFQNYALYPHKTVYENLAFPLQIASQSKDLIDERVKLLASKMGLSDYLKRKPKELSGGQRQRVALARAMTKEPKLFLLDEPLSNLDAKLRTQMRHELHSLHKESGATFIYVTHDQVEALSLADKIVVLNQGVIQQIASPEEIYAQPANSFVASFIGSPGTNIFELDGKQVGIRPEFFDLSQKSSQIKVKIKNIELLASEVLLYCDYQGQQIIAKINRSDYQAELINKKNSVLPLYFDKNMLYYFYLTQWRASWAYLPWLCFFDE